MKCCDVRFSYSHGNMMPKFIDVESGQEVVPYSENNTVSEFYRIFDKAYQNAARVTNTMPCTFILIGDMDYTQDVVLINTDAQMACSFIPKKMYACYIKWSRSDDLTFTCIDRVDGNEIKIDHIPMDLKEELNILAERIKLSRYRGFNKLGSDSIIISGNVSNVKDNSVIISSDDNLMVGTTEAIYSVLWDQLIERFS